MHLERDVDVLRQAVGLLSKEAPSHQVVPPYVCQNMCCLVVSHFNLVCRVNCIDPNLTRGMLRSIHLTSFSGPNLI